MSKVKRTIDDYQVRLDAAQRWPDWTLYLTDLAGIPELFVPDRKTILIDISVCQDPERALAHAVAHLDLHLNCLRHGLSCDQEAEADGLADLRLDREGSRPV